MTVTALTMFASIVDVLGPDAYNALRFLVSFATGGFAASFMVNKYSSDEEKRTAGTAGFAIGVGAFVLFDVILTLCILATLGWMAWVFAPRLVGMWMRRKEHWTSEVERGMRGVGLSYTPPEQPQSNTNMSIAEILTCLEDGDIEAAKETARHYASNNGNGRA